MFPAVVAPLFAIVVVAADADPDAKFPAVTALIFAIVLVAAADPDAKFPVVAL